MPPIGWLLVSGAAAVAAYLIGWPAWSAYRSREARDTNTERYLTWRGRADRRASAREGMTGEERRRIYLAVALAVVAAASLLAFFFTS